MRLLTKTILIAITVVSVCSVALYGVSSYFLARSYERMEDESTVRDLNRVTSSIDFNLTMLGHTTLDWAVWNDSYNFALDLNQEYIDNNLTDITFVNANFNLLAYFDDSLRLIHFKVFNLETLQSVPLTTADKILLQAFVDRDIDYTDGAARGILKLDSGILMAAAYPILDDRNSPAAGIMVCGRYFNNVVLKEIAENTGMNLRMRAYDESDVIGPEGEKLNLNLFTNNVYIQKISSRSLNAYLLLDDFKGQPTQIIETTIPRELMQEGQHTISWMHLIIVLMALVFVAMTSAMIYLLIISRVRRLTDGLQRVADKHDLSIRIPVKGKDEIAVLTRQANNTLDQISRTQFDLKSSEERFRKISEVARDVIYQIRVKPDLQIEYISASVEQTLGFTPQEIAADPLWLMKAIHTDDREKLIDLLNKAPNMTRISDILRWKHKDGHTVWVEHVNSIIVDYSGNQVRGIGSGRDISERVHLENNLLVAFEKEKEARLELEKESKARAFFIDVLGHELKTPMTPLLISMDILKDKTDPELTPLQHKLIGNAADSVRVLAARLDELLDLTRFARGTFTLEPQNLNINEFLANTVEKFRPGLINRKQSLNVLIAPDLGSFKADPFRLEQVILNLLSNASKFSEDGQEIHFRARVNNGSLEVEIEDHGIGLSHAEQQRLFEPYHRVEQDRQKFSGLGLGLAVSRQIVEAHGGRLTVVSESGKGSTFRFTIPLKDLP